MNAALALAIGAVALLYASVGHAGATGYIAVMTLFGIAPVVIRPTALVLNVIVATIATAQFVRAGHFRGSLFWPLAAASVPCALVGGAIRLPTGAFEKLVGIVLAGSALRLMRDAWAPGGAPDAAVKAPPTPPSTPVMAVLGGGIGLLSGLTGVGGGVFLTPVLLALRAASVKQIAAATAPFILVNSLAGLAGGLVGGRALPAVSLPVIAAAVLGGAIGSQLGAFRLPVRAIQFLMAAVLAIASVKLFGL
ncbi:MAG: sulfite exporter TauE/SafE family protein [Planctomycetia bacterium]